MNPGAYQFVPGGNFVPGAGQPGQPGQQQQGGQPGANPYNPYAQQQQQAGGYYGQQGGYQQGSYGGGYQQGGYGGGYQAGGYGQPQGGYQGGFVPRAQQFQPQQQQYQQPAAPANTTTTLPGRQSYIPPASTSAPAKAVSLSIGGGAGASTSTPAKSMSISIGSKKVNSTPEKKDAAATTDKPAAPAKSMSISIGGAKKPAAVEGNKSDSPAKAPAAEKPNKEAEPADWDAAEAEPAKKAAPAPEPVAAAPAPAAAEETPSAPAPKAAASSIVTESKTNFSRQVASTDADAIAQEAARIADADLLQELYGGEEADPNIKPNLNVVFIGHVDAGKSTMGGQLLALTGMVDRRTLEKYQKEAKEMGRESWYLSWALDSDTKERAKGKTVEVGRAYFETDVRRYTVLDAPGHKTYIPSMITGSSQADLAALVISARKGEFETGFEKGGQTREHALLVKSNGINKLVVVINKMDDPTVAWDKARYDEIVEKLTLFLKSVGYNPKTDITFIPVSAFTGANMKDRLDPKVASWYSGPALLEYLDNMPIDDRKYNEAFMFPVSEKYNELGAIAVGKIESGRVKKGDTVLLMPNRERIEVGAIYDEQGAELDGALCGDNVRIRLKNVNEDGLQPGFVLTSPIRPVQVARRFEAQVAILDSKNIMAAGFACIMHLHTLSEEITFVQLLNYYDKKTGRKSRKPPAFAKKGMKVLVLIETTAPICVETFANQPSLGRFTLRDEGKTIGIGKVTKIRDRADMPSIEELNIKDTPEAAA